MKSLSPHTSHILECVLFGVDLLLNVAAQFLEQNFGFLVSLLQFKHSDIIFFLGVDNVVKF